jgi:carboxyl-terminal processing protease
MPPRNLATIMIMVVVSMICHTKATRNHFASLVAEGMVIVSQNSLEPVQSRELFENAMSGMVRGLDPHSSYIPPADFQPLQESLDQQFGGIGIYLDTNPDTEQLTVLSPVVGTPAFRAGIRAGDVILAIDGQTTELMTRDDAANLVRGQPGTDVVLRVQHLGEAGYHDVTVERAVIMVPSVLGDMRDADGRWQFVLHDHPRIGYIRITSFGEKTVGELKQALSSINGSVDALIIDVRNNAGGLLSAAVETCDLFLGKGVIVSTRGRQGQIRSHYEASPQIDFDTNLPITVLINKFSASASEILAACLQDHGRATVAGERSWGKGTVQNIYPFEGGRSAIRLTVASYWRPNGENIHRGRNAKESDAWGVRPNPGLDTALTDEQMVQLSRQRMLRDVMLPGSGSPILSGQHPGANGVAQNQSSDPHLPAQPDSAAKGNSENGNPPPPADPLIDLQLQRAVDHLLKIVPAR